MFVSRLVTTYRKITLFRRLGRTCCLHLQGDLSWVKGNKHNIIKSWISQKTFHLIHTRIYTTYVVWRIYEYIYEIGNISVKSFQIWERKAATRILRLFEVSCETRLYSWDPRSFCELCTLNTWKQIKIMVTEFRRVHVVICEQTRDKGAYNAYATEVFDFQ